MPGPGELITVVVVDDHAAVLAALVELIDGQPDMEVVGTAVDADEAVVTTTAGRPDIVVMDVRMPGGGYDATRRILARLPGTAVIALSAQEDSDTRRRMRRAGAVAFASKTARPDRLLTLIRRHGPGGDVNGTGTP